MSIRDDFVEKPLNDFFKRIFDIIFSLLGIILLLPILIIISIIIKLTSKGPILFTQVRVGKNKANFKILKFRTMVIDAEKIGRQITVGHDPRITSIGRILRKYKLDELPQLFNVLLGQMSFVGPRPEVPKYTNFYNEQQSQVLKVKPGITDYASIKYSDENAILGVSEDPEKIYITQVMPDKLSINLEYIARRSVLEDMKIIFLTLSKIIN